jgi:DNA invertase Pin-like site-specific DNA recombinase
MKKVVLLVRVSSEKQDYDDQRKELVQFAMSDGYNEEDMEILQHKESGTKLSDDERQGLNRMFEVIEDPQNQIKVVYVWELSRLSRRMGTVFSVMETLADKNIDLRIKDKNFSMLNSKSSYELIGLYAGASKSEIEVRKDRTERKKRANALKCGFGGGNFEIKYGYTVVNKTFVVDKVKGDIVDKIFTLYSEQKYGGATGVLKELEELGMADGLSKRLVEQILRSRAYTGEVSDERKVKEKGRISIRYPRCYPQIITVELFNKCRDISKKNNTVIDKAKNVYYGSKLVKCLNCGRSFKANKGSGTYICSGQYSTKTQEPCTCKDSISINVLDTALWETAITSEISHVLKFEEAERTSYKNKIKELQIKIDNADKQYINIVNDKFKNLKKAITTLNDDEINKLAIKETESERKRISNEKKSHQIDIEHFETLLSKSSSTNLFDFTTNIDIENITDNIAIMYETLDKLTDNEKYNIIHKHIKHVSISKINEYTKIDIETYIDDNNASTKIYYYNNHNNHNKQLFYDNKIVQVVKRINPRARANKKITQ